MNDYEVKMLVVTKEKEGYVYVSVEAKTEEEAERKALDFFSDFTEVERVRIVSVEKE